MSKDNLVISKDAAKTIGLNEAVLLEILNTLYKTLKKALLLRKTYKLKLLSGAKTNSLKLLQAFQLRAS